MATKGLEGIWGLEQIDRTDIETWKLSSLVLGATLLLGLLLVTILPPVNHGSMLASFFTPEVVSIIFMFVSFQIGLVIAVIVYLARSTEADLHKISKVDVAAREAIDRLQPRLRLFLPVTLVMVLVGPLMLPALTTVISDISFVDSLSRFFNAGITLNVLLLFLYPIAGLVTGIFFSMVATQIPALNHAARTTKINLPQLDRYSAIANPAIRVVILILISLSSYPLMILYNPEFTDAVTSWGLLMIAVAWPVVLAYFTPAIILRNRIRLRKQKELEAIFRSLDGDDQAISTISIGSRGAPVTTSDLLTHQMFVESRWEWPIAAHVQKLILFGLLPPLTWVGAAMIENILY